MKTLLFTMLLFPNLALSQVGIGTTSPDQSAVLEISSLTKGILIPRLTKAQVKAIINPAIGLIVYITDARTEWFYINGLSFPYAHGKLCFYNGVFWEEIKSQVINLNY